MGMLLGALAGAGAALDQIADHRLRQMDDDRAFSMQDQADREKENRIREANRQDTALARKNHLDDYQMARENAVTDEANKYALDHSQERINDANNERIASLQKDADFNNSQFNTKLDQATRLDKATDHTDYASRAMELKINQAKLDAAYEEAKGMSVADRRVAEGLHKMTDSYQKIITSTESSDIAKADAVTELTGTQAALKGLYKKNGVNFGDTSNPLGANIDSSVSKDGNVGTDWGDKPSKSNNKNQYDEEFKKASSTYGVPLPILKATASIESGIRQFDDNGKPMNPGTSSATGVMQVIPRWWPQYDKDKLSSDPGYNILAGAEILRGLYDKTDPKLPSNERTSLALQKYYGSKDEAENIAYANKVMGVSKQFSVESGSTESNKTVAAKEDHKPESQEKIDAPVKDYAQEQPPRGLLNAMQESGRSSRTPSGMLKNASDSINLITDRMDFLKDKSIEFKNAFSHMPLEQQIAELKKAGY